MYILSHSLISEKSKVQLELRVRPYPLAVLDEEPHHGQHGHGDEGQQAIAPADAQGGVQAPTGKRQERTAQAPQHGIGRHCAGGVRSVRVDEVRADGHEAGDHANAEERGADDGHDPVDEVVRAPAVEEEPERDYKGAGPQQGQAVLGLHLAPFGQSPQVLVGEKPKRRQPDELPRPEPQVHQPDVAEADAIAFVEDECHGRDQNVHVPVRDGDEQRETEDDRREEQHFRRPHD